MCRIDGDVWEMNVISGLESLSQLDQNATLGVSGNMST